MDFEITLAILIAATLILALAFFKARQPRMPGATWPVPWHGIMFFTILIILLMINHLFTLNNGTENPMISQL